MRSTLPTIVLTLFAAPAVAGDYDVFFGDRPGGRVCYNRSYDSDHLRAHDRQKVRQIVLDFDAAKADGDANRATRFAIRIGVKLRAGKAWLTRAGLCNERAVGGFECFLEGDAGRFKLAPSDFSLRMTLDREMTLEGDGFITFGGKESDDNTFVLSPAVNRLCDPASGAGR